MTNVGPSQHRNLLLNPKRLEQQEETQNEGHDAGPDHRERAKNEDEHHRLHCVLGKLVFGCDHILSLPSVLCAEKREQHWLCDWHDSAEGDLISNWEEDLVTGRAIARVAAGPGRRRHRR